jgi:hypothetical protein
MIKPKLSEFKKLINQMNEEELREELLKLFGKLKEVQSFYAQDLLTDADRENILKENKQKIYKEFWTSKGNPRSPSNANIRKLISDFEKIAAFPIDVIDLLMYRVETATKFADEFGGMSEADYNASINAFDKAVKLIAKHRLKDNFLGYAQDIFMYDNLDYWYIDQLETLWEDEFGTEEN